MVLWGLVSSFQSGGYRPDPFAKFGDLPFPMRTANTFNYLSIRIPRQKCIHFAFDAQGKFGNPYGRSLLRRAHKYYVLKDTVLTMLAIALDRKGTPLTLAYADPNVTVLDSKKTPQGVNMKGRRDVGKRLDEAVRDAFKNVHNDSFIVLPGKKGELIDTDFVPQTSNAQDFIATLDFCNKSILRALLIPTLIFGNGDGTGSFALGQEHAKTFDKILDSENAGFEQVLLQQYIKELLAYNFPRSAWEKDGLGEFSKRDLSQDEKEKEFDMLDKAVNLGAIDMNDLQDLNIIRAKAGFAPRTKPIERDDMFGMEEDYGDEGQEQDDERGDKGNKKSGNTPARAKPGGKGQESAGHHGSEKSGKNKE